MEVYTLAAACILFETLIQKNLVRKHNRRVYLDTCILISFKHEIYGGYEDNHEQENPRYQPPGLNKALFAQLQADMDTLMKNIKPEKDLLTYELVVLQTLNFNICPHFSSSSFKLIETHMKSILVMIDGDLRDILGEQFYQSYMK